MLKSVIPTLLLLLPAFYANAENPGNAEPAPRAGTAEDYAIKASAAYDQGDVVNAFALYRKAAEAGYAPAQNRLAYLLDESEENEEAVKWYQRSAAQGDPEGEAGLARMYATGDGIEPNESEALRLYTLSAGKDYTPAIRIVATAYEKGELGVRADYEVAREWLEKGARLNDYWALKRLHSAYSNGELGLRIDRQKAAQFEAQLANITNKGAGQP